MVPFKCYFTFELKDCHTVKRLKIMKDIDEKIEPVIFYPIMQAQEVLRFYVHMKMDGEHFRKMN